MFDYCGSIYVYRLEQSKPNSLKANNVMCWGRRFDIEAFLGMPVCHLWKIRFFEK